MDRRGFLRLSAGLAAMAPRARADAPPIRVSLRPRQTGNAIAADFTGLSYETAQLANPHFFSAENTQLIGFVRRLGTRGVLRTGGNTSAFSVWTAEPPPDAPSPDEAVGPDTGRQAAPHRPVTPAAIRNLREFLDAAGWTLIYGLNMGGEGPEVAAAEAEFVMRTMGPKLIAFQLCNEPDLFHRNGVRRPDYDFRQFAREWRRYFDAVRRRVPKAPFAGPDTAYNNDWLLPFAKMFKREVAFLSQHYYAEGPPSDPAMTIERLLRPAARLEGELAGMAQTCRDTGLCFRMAETNSCYGGGKQFVSDTYASALWGAELMFKLAAAGGSGINFHGGGYGWYTPVAGAPARGFLARPLYYGMLLFAEAGPGALAAADTEGATDAPLLSVYGLRDASGALKLAAFNKHADRDFTLLVDPGTPAATASAMRLVAPRLDDTADVTFAGAPVGPTGDWSPLIVENLALAGGLASLSLPRASAALIRFA